jgi:hypothetical protein
MLTKYDELLCHQIVDTFDSVGTSAREWTERIWFSVHDTSGKYHLVAGFGMYPNRNIMDAYACFAVDGKKQYNARASRVLRPGLSDVEVGPLSYDIAEPLKKVRLTLKENDSGITFDLTFTATMAPHEEKTQTSRDRGRVLEDIKRYVQVGRPAGWIALEGKRIKVDEKSWRAERDHSWGIRRGGGVPETGVQPGEIPVGYVFNFLIAQFNDWSITYHLRENWDGSIIHFGGAISYPLESSKEELDLTVVDHNFTFRQDMRQINGGSVLCHTSDGATHKLVMNKKSVCYLKGGGYFGFRDFIHGLWMGESYFNSVTVDITNPEEEREISFLEDVHFEIQCEDETGFGIVEMVCIGKNTKYGYEGF